MTVVAWDGQTLAVDSALSGPSARQSTTKLSLIEADGRTFAVTGYGETRALLAMKAWAEAGADPDEFPQLLGGDGDDTLMVVVDLELGYVFGFNGTPDAIPIKGVPLAFGAGADLALGAMLQGARAASAVRLACEHVDGCAEPVRFATGARPGVVLTA